MPLPHLIILCHMAPNVSSDIYRYRNSWKSDNNRKKNKGKKQINEEDKES